MENKRYLGIDYGSKRVGLSLSDPLGIIAQPYDTLINDALLITHIKRLITIKNITTIVVGLPLNLKGKSSKKTEEVVQFVEALKNEVNVDILTWDERFTTSIAQQTMLNMGTKLKNRQKKDGRVDSIAAAIMLQGFLDRKRN